MGIMGKNKNKVNLEASEKEVGGGFKVLKWRLLDSSSAEAEADYYCAEFFVKSHDVRETISRKPRNRTLFVINIPPIISEGNLRDLFNRFGEIKDVFLHQNPTKGLPAEIHPYFPDDGDLIRGFKIAYIVFEEPKSVTDILNLKPTNTSPLDLSGGVSTGMQKWIAEYNNAILPISILEKDVKDFMANYEMKEFQRSQEEKNAEGQPDEDGWVKVTRRGKRPGTQRTELTEEKLKAKKRRFEKQLLNFTPSQIKESRVKELADLKRKFEEDKQRVAFIRQNRKFKPF